MDLVDIDQVLDNLELKEQAEELQRLSLLQSAGGQNSISNNGYVVAGSNSSNAATIAASSNCSTNSKGFIGVSQVFNSLDDYRKNVESLTTSVVTKYDEECRPLKDSTILEHKKIETSNSNLDQNYKQFDEQLSSNDSLESPIECKRIEILEDEDQASKDIHKFKENERKVFSSGSKNDNEDDDVSVSESLTTSSPSTFSSGPSLGGLGSTADEPLSPEDDVEEQSALLPEETDIQDEHLPSDNDIHLNQNLDETENGESKPEVECLAEGLSSISITSANGNSLLRCDASASSVLDNVLEDLETETTSTSLLSQMPEKLETDQILFSPEQLNKEMEPKVQEQLSVETNYLLQKVKEQQEEEQHLPKPLAKDNDDEDVSVKPNQNQYQQPITFCSTMDDISDTELDSMLQEMDIDEEQEKATQNSDVKVETPVEEKAEVVEENESEPNIDNPNADSFSQASTVEFSEVKANTVPIVDAEEKLASQNSAASSFSSTSSSSLDEPPVNGESLAEQNQEENGNGKPQRPTTLDLPVLNPAAYSNAGQTPPELDGTVPQPSCNLENSENQAPITNDNIVEASGFSDPHANLGKIPPIWVPDNMAAGCMQCTVKFTVIKRRHHCRACGKVLCSVCCSQKFKLEFLQEPESRVCVQCYLILTQRQHYQHHQQQSPTNQANHIVRNSEAENEESLRPTQPTRSPNPNNPMEYCSTIPPHRQVSNVATPPPTVIVPVGVLKKNDGSYSSNSSGSNKQARKRKSVMFSDGIAPGSELASNLEQQWGEAKQARRNLLQGGNKQNNNANKPPTPAKVDSQKDITTMGLVASLFRGSIPPSAAAAAVSTAQQATKDVKTAATSLPPSPKKESTNSASSEGKNAVVKRLPPGGCDKDGCFISQDNENLPPLLISKGDGLTDYDYQEVENDFNLIEKLQKETLKFAIKTNFIVYVKIVNLKCCMNRTVINFTTCGMHYVGNDEVIILLEYEQPPESKEQMQSSHLIPKDIFNHLYEIYKESEAGRPIAELSYTSPRQANFLGSREYGGFMFIRTTFQCLQEIVVPENPFLCGILIHRHEVPWAKIFPLRLMLRLGAQFRYYPCPHISVRNRESVYAEIAQTIINFLADFRQYSYTLPTIRGMYIHMEDRQTTVIIPRNRVEDVIKAINNASDHILALGGNFSKTADGHLVCMQNINDDRSEMYSYSTQAINIQGQPRKVTGASFIVFNESLKTTSGLSGKCSIVEDGLMVQVLTTKMDEIRNCLRNRQDINIVCGPINADEHNTEIVALKWVDNDRDINIGVKSPIDDKSMEGISSMRVHASFNYSNAKLAIRLTDIFILKHENWYNPSKPNASTASTDVTRIAEQIARSASMAMVPFLDLLAASGSTKIGLRTTLHQDNVCYEAGARGTKLPPLYMNALDNHLIPTLHNESSNIEEEIILELIFYILNV